MNWYLPYWHNARLILYLLALHPTMSSFWVSRIYQVSFATSQKSAQNENRIKHYLSLLLEGTISFVSFFNIATEFFNSTGVLIPCFSISFCKEDKGICDCCLTAAGRSWVFVLTFVGLLIFGFALLVFDFDCTAAGFVLPFAVTAFLLADDFGVLVSTLRFALSIAGLAFFYLDFRPSDHRY